MKSRILSSNCIVVDGVKRDLLLDLQGQKMYFIPKNSLTEKGGIHKGCDPELLDELIELGILLELNHPEGLLELDFSYNFPSTIKKSSIDIGKQSTYDLLSVINQLEELHCRFIEIRYYTKLEISDLQKYLLKMQESIIECIDLYLPYDSSKQIEQLVEIKNQYPRLRHIFIHSCTSELDIKNSQIIVTSQVIDSDSHCGNISYFYFSPNLNLVSESKNHNNCLNQKVSIDVNGDIKNCPSMKIGYGNVANTKISDAINNLNFKDVWNITKDSVAVCKECEFRYVCTDCRVFTDDPNDIYSRPSKCKYNPYVALWEGEAGYVKINEMTELEIERARQTSNV